MAAGQIVPAFEVLDATNRKVLDGWHAIAYYWVGKNPAAALFAGPPGGPFGMDHMDYLRSEERRVGKSVDLGGRRIIKKKNRNQRRTSRRLSWSRYSL